MTMNNINLQMDDTDYYTAEQVAMMSPFVTTAAQASNHLEIDFKDSLALAVSNTLSPEDESFTDADDGLDWIKNDNVASTVYGASMMMWPPNFAAANNDIQQLLSEPRNASVGIDATGLPEQSIVALAAMLRFRANGIIQVPEHSLHGAYLMINTIRGTVPPVVEDENEDENEEPNVANA